MKKYKIAVIAALTIIIVFILYRGILGNTKINGVPYNLVCSEDELNKRLNSTSQKAYFKDDKLEKEFVKYEYDVKDIVEHSTARKFLDNLTGKRYKVKYKKTFLKDEFKEYLKKYNESRTESSDAYIYKDGEQYQVEKEVQGDRVDENKILSDIDNGVIIDLNKYIINPSVYEKDLDNTAKEMNVYNSWSATYSNGQTIRPDGYTVTLNDDNTLSINDNFIDDQIRNAVASYCTVGDGINFKCNDGVERIVSGGTWGTNVNYEEEIAYLKDCFNKHENVENRTPIFSIEYGEIGNTYIEISIEKQHLWYYKDGAVTVECDIVTGLPDGKRDTPTGVYYISERIPGKFLVGETYRTWVNFWMRLTNSGVGLHDAIWQHAFGGDLYYSKGSHGCINLSYDFAEYLYNVTYVGMPVIIYS